MSSINEIGEASIAVKADLSDLKGVGAEVRREMEAIGDDADVAGQKISSGFDGATKKIGESTEGIRRFSSALTSSIGVITGITGAAGLLVGAFVGIGRSMIESAKETAALNERLRELDRTIQEFDPTSTVSGLSDLTKEYDQLYKMISKSGAPLEEQQRQWDALDTAMKNAKASMRDAGFDQLKDQAEKSAAGLQTLIDALNSQITINPIEIAEDEYGKTLRQIDEISARLEKARRGLIFADPEEFAKLTAQQQVLEEKARAAAEELFERRLEEVAKEEEIRSDAAQKRMLMEAEAAAKREAEADRRSQARIQREIDQLREGISGIFGSEFTTLMNNLTGATQDAANALGRLKR